ncbi:MAG: dihydrofolate reductase family protein [Hyphomicrobiales bacterium]|nr:dihydrofolate reductase family protein [Hyphomicrobiales bacterium]
MRDLAIITFVTLDGVMQAPSMADEDLSGGFTQGGWAAPYWGETMEQVQREAMAAPYDMLFGRKTYDLFAGHFSTAEKSAVSERMNAARKYVVTSRPDELNWTNSVAVTGDIPAEIKKLKLQEGPLLQIHGSCELVQTLLRHELIDEFRLWTFPVLTGNGKRLFANDLLPASVALRRLEAFSNGVYMSIYRRV